MSVVDRQGNKIWYGKTLSDPESIIHSLRAWHKEIELIGLEACPLSEWIFAGLRDQGLNVRCIETCHAQRFLSFRPNKTNRNDADGIAQMMRLGHFKPVHVKSRTAQGIQTIIAARAQIVNTMVKFELTARGLIKKFEHKIAVVAAYHLLSAFEWQSLQTPISTWLSIPCSTSAKHSGGSNCRMTKCCTQCRVKAVCAGL